MKSDGKYLSPAWWDRRDTLEWLIFEGADVDTLAHECSDLISELPSRPACLTDKQIMMRALAALGLETKRMKERRLYVRRVELQQAKK